MKNFFYIIFTYILINVNSLIYQVKPLFHLKKSLRKLSPDNSFLHYIQGDSYYLNYYYTSLYLGKNKTRQVYILDTGSSITTSPCSLCESCGEHLDPKYPLESKEKILSCDDNKCKMASSSRCTNDKCSFNIGYAEGSRLSGLYVQQDVFFETINMENNITEKSYNIPIGCTTTETHLFKTQLADGIMGLNKNENSFVGVMHKLGIIQKNIFSLCFEHDGGYFSIGKIYDEYHYSKNIQYTSIVTSAGNYMVKLKYLKIGEDKVDFNGLAIIDSGTTMTYFPPQKFQEIMKIILSKCEKSKKCGKLQKFKNFGYCTPIDTDEDIAQLVENGWGNLTFTFGENATFVWMPKHYHYIYRAKENDKFYLCLGFDEENRSTILLGTTFMHGCDFIFDNEKKRLGMIEANCNRKNEDEENDKDENNHNEKNNSNINDIINIDNFETEEINNNISNNISNIISNIKNNNISNNELILNKSMNNISENDMNENQLEINDKNNFDNLMIKICFYIICFVFILFIIFNIILCRDNYIAIQSRKDEEDIDKFVLDNSRYDINIGPTSLFNDNI